MISYILGFRTSEIVDETVMALVSMFAPRHPPAVKYDYATYIANKIHEQFMNLERERVFKYTSYIYHLLLYYQSDSFPVFLKKLDAKEEQRSVIFWTSVFHLVSESPYTYCEFIDLFIYPATSLLSTDPPPRLTAEMQRILHLSKGYSISDWYYYQYHTVIRIYGCELAPHRLPKYVPMRLFALEYYRKFNSADLTHFYGARKKAELKIRYQLGPFIFNKREEAWKDADTILGEKLKLKLSFLWSPYDPEHFIRFRRVKNKLTGYVHHEIPEIEKYANQQEWVEGTLVEELTEEEIIETTIKNLEKLVDLESFG